jgi:hypothetical protein
MLLTPTFDKIFIRIVLRSFGSVANSVVNEDGDFRMIVSNLAGGTIRKWIGDIFGRNNKVVDFRYRDV